MFIGTHIFAPVLLAGTTDLIRGATGRDALFSGNDLCRIGFCGLLPDLLNPHIRLAARMSSWSHTVWFVAAAALAIALIHYRKPEGHRLWPGLFCAAAVILHLAGDMIAGGIAPFYPLNTRRFGAYYIHYTLWLQLDVLVTGLALGIVLWSRRVRVKLRDRETA